MQPISLNDPLTKLAEKWYLPVIAAIIGGILGMVFSLLFPPRYEAAAAFTVGVNYGTLDFDELIIEDRILDRVWQLVRADETLHGTIDLLNAEYGEGEAWETLDAIKAHTRVDSRLSRWELIGMDRDPQVATAIANAWYQVSLDRLDEAYEHAWRAMSIPGAHFDLGCVTLHPEMGVSAFWECIVVAPDLSADLAAELRTEIQASHGILPVLSYEPLGEASIPESPILWSRGVILFAASGLGFLLGIILVITVPVESLAVDAQAKSKAEEG